ncbi:peptide chain release factor N(5)-glutamine methyltransferase [Helicobacter sp. 11S03491-1]|uniref:peptide chain release factor N(5)-glutamine methyltransferase n=1 Tax=Helicobacter sp. 11S03491-1 TaxID=1476196 RepID=UPI000BCF9443|nr:peptide chain release factor N(5)-glutamine methyltransferase [Helicobacter sp. 11S03491-1]PAF41314.1 protein-(glutamine-N5) methyltransferase, release factor-specific [Helicobacter sp. 11S03491-1]
MNIFQALGYAKREFLNCSYNENVRIGLEAELLLGFVMDCTREWLHTWGEREVDECELREFMGCVCRRIRGEPIEYIIQSASFYGEKFYVDQRVLIPRPETEILVQKVQNLMANYSIRTLAEIGVGSGIISITLALKNLDILITATDISNLAIEVAQTNIEQFSTRKNTLEERINLVCTNLLDGIEGDFDLLVSNPPYIAQDYPLEKNVLYEPKIALFGGICGDEILKNIIKLGAKKRIKFLACEMGYDQKETFDHYLQDHGYDGEFYKDLSGLDRGFVAILRD